MRLSVSEGLGRPDAVIVPGGGWTGRTPRGTWHEVQAGVLPARLAEAARTCRAGVTAGLDLSLWIVERECGPAVADAVTREIEHQRVKDVHRSLRGDK